MPSSYNPALAAAEEGGRMDELPSVEPLRDARIVPQ